MTNQPVQLNTPIKETVLVPVLYVKSRTCAFSDVLVLALTACSPSNDDGSSLAAGSVGPEQTSASSVVPGPMVVSGTVPDGAGPHGTVDDSELIIPACETPPAGPGPATPSSPAGASVPVSIDRTRGTLPDAVVDELLQGGDSAGMAFLYPYDKTVFPGGILPPLLQWTQNSTSVDGVYLHLYSLAFDYREVFAGGADASVELPLDAWEAAAEQSQGASDPLTVELTTISGSTVSGPIKQEWILARGQLKSAVYYNTYDSSLVFPANGAVMRILPLEKQPEVIKTVPGGVLPLGPCYSCHSLSANGQTLAAQRHQYPGGPYTSEAFDVAANPEVDPPAMSVSSAGIEDWGFSALFPDGSRLLTAGQPVTTDTLFATFPFAAENNPGMLGPRASALVDTRTGATLPATGLISYAMMPSFSTDGTMVVFNDYDNGQGHSLSVMDFDQATNTFSNRREIFRDASLYPGWPFFTPTAEHVVFALGNGSDFATVQDPPVGLQVNSSDLHIVSSAGGAAVALDHANGAELTARDRHLNYYPTVSPVAAGGYFWVFFTSRRTYGNVMTGPASESTTKKIWVSAVDIVSGAEDPSHPPFYLSGQELTSGNIRAFATLSPCHPDGASCTTGVDCCGGFCVEGTCAPPVGCSNLDDKCTTNDDCCDGLSCIGGFCGVRMPGAR